MCGGSERTTGSDEPDGPPAGGGTDPGGGPPAEHLREFMRERFGDVPPESPTEPQHEAGEPEADRDEGTDEDDTEGAREPL